MLADHLNDFIDCVKDIQGYLLALTINYSGVEERVAPYIDLLRRVQNEDVHPEEFYQGIIELRSAIVLLASVYPETESEIGPCLGPLDHLVKMMHTPQ